MEAVTNFIFLVSKVTADGDCSREMKRCLLLGRKAMTNLDSVIKKQKHHFVDKGPYSQSYVQVGLQRKPSAKELMLLNCGVGEDS